MAAGLCSSGWVYRRWRMGEAVTYAAVNMGQKQLQQPPRGVARRQYGGNTMGTGPVGGQWVHECERWVRGRRVTYRRCVLAFLSAPLVSLLVKPLVARAVAQSGAGQQMRALLRW